MYNGISTYCVSALELVKLILQSTAKIDSYAIKKMVKVRRIRMFSPSASRQGLFLFGFIFFSPTGMNSVYMFGQIGFDICPHRV